ncbi:hypothetical protein AMAG_14875 [Allomyces macrogynus ATCC 38327]|uniref:FHA domain-containing protein n=1 Tax=Allomyces macrogynus (strain ATCC 38327) TaxID=578462 RepID=A0A0L0T852_ALLM3|nr:hypothetical protein AMAG_14875 [Allomyces macrogynus ATCC 38327]|eukprot:KNE70749.1 hypothetical protein AMAG_14875 [Allomyces macrogynus ATCC 38327]
MDADDVAALSVPPADLLGAGSTDATHPPLRVAEQYPRGPDDEPQVSAYAKLAGHTWTYFITKTVITIGRASEVEEDPDVDLGPTKTVSRRHAVIQFNHASAGWEVAVTGRNGLKVNGNVFKPADPPVALRTATRFGSVARNSFSGSPPTRPTPPTTTRPSTRTTLPPRQLLPRRSPMTTSTATTITITTATATTTAPMTRVPCWSPLISSPPSSSSHPRPSRAPRNVAAVVRRRTTKSRPRRMPPWPKRWPRCRERPRGPGARAKRRRRPLASPTAPRRKGSLRARAPSARPNTTLSQPRSMSASCRP